jgi:carbonic anhydrase
MAAAVPGLASALRPGVEPAHRARHCQEELVRLALENLLSYPWIASRVNGGTLHLHGWHIDPATGALHILDPASDLFEDVT